MQLTKEHQVEKVFEEIAQVQAHIQMLDDVIHFCGRIANTWEHSELGAASLRAWLFEKETSLWRDLAMWGLTVDKPLQDRVKAAVHDRYFNKTVSVANYMSDFGLPASRWLQADEEEFKKMVAEAFKP